MKKSCTIIISHYESLPFLRTCLRHIEKHRHPDIKHNVVIVDQSCSHTFSNIIEIIGGSDTIAYNLDPLYSGYGLDWLFRTADIYSDYICQLHADAFPISNQWLKAPITLMEENSFMFSGVLQFISDGTQPIYPPNKPFFSMAQSFNIGRTDVYKEMSLEAGFTRFHNRPQSGLTFNNNDWSEWAKVDYEKRGSDDDVVAFCWEDSHREHNKIGLAVTSKMGIHGEESGYGSIIEDLVFHFGFCRESVGVMPQMGEKYREWTKRINEDYSDELIEEMLAVSRKQPLVPERSRRIWDGKLKKAYSAHPQIISRLNQLKHGLE